MELGPAHPIWCTTFVVVPDRGPKTINLARFRVLCGICERPIVGKIRWTIKVWHSDNTRNDISFHYYVNATWAERPPIAQQKR